MACNAERSFSFLFTPILYHIYSRLSSLLCNKIDKNPDYFQALLAALCYKNNGQGVCVRFFGHIPPPRVGLRQRTRARPRGGLPEAAPRRAGAARAGGPEGRRLRRAEAARGRAGGGLGSGGGCSRQGRKRVVPEARRRGLGGVPLCAMRFGAQISAWCNR